MSQSSDWLERFRQPPSEYRSMPLWVWNGAMTEDRIRTMLGQYAEQGMGGVFVHPRPGLITPYLSERWFELWGYALEQCKRLGLECNVYDENSYPSGFAGGHVPSRIPHAVLQYVDAVCHESGPIRIRGELMGAYRLTDEGAQPAPAGVSPDEAVQEGPVLTIELLRDSGSSWLAWFPFVDQMRPEVGETFLEVTHERYAERFPDDLGETIAKFFIDEPHLGYPGVPVGKFPFSRFAAKEFQAEHGYSIFDRLADLFVDQAGAEATRHDYYATLQRLWTTNFLGKISSWCDDNGAAFTGHFMEHEWPNPYISPNSTDANRLLHIPGIDLLAPQVGYDRMTESPHMLLTVRELNSVANQLGRERRFCEAHGVAGHEATFERMKRLIDWLIVHGVNFINEHLSFETIAGARKYDHPVTFSDHSPWWPHYRYLNDHVARLTAAACQGVQRNRVLVLHPTTTGWTRANPLRSPSRIEGLQATAHGTMAALRESQDALTQWLCDCQVDFDFGDELVLRDLGAADDAKLRVGEGAYDVVVLPENMDTWLETTLTLMEAYLDSGGVVLALGEAPGLVAGRPDPRPGQLAERYPERWRRVSCHEEMQEVLDDIAPRRLTVEGRSSVKGLGHQARFLDDGARLHILTNSAHDSVTGTASVRGGSVSRLDTFTGVHERIAVKTRGGHVEIPVTLPSAGHEVWVVRDNADAEAPLPPASPAWRPAALEGEIHAYRRDANAIALDYCSVETPARRAERIPVTEANRIVWQDHGFDIDIWDRSVQFSDSYATFVDQFGDESGFTLEYFFHIEEGDFDAVAAAGVTLAVERPELYEVAVNGRPAAFTAAAPWFDEAIRAVDVSAALRPGPNTVTMRANPFHILCEPAPVYLTGDFGARPHSRGFALCAASPLGVGDWTRQGLPMYAGAVRYVGTVDLAEGADRLRVGLPEWAGAVAQVFVDERAEGYIAFPPYRLEVERALSPGKHQVAVAVYGTLRNLMGPHFGTRQPGYAPGPFAWLGAPATQPAGADYELDPYGLTAPFTVETA